MRLQCARKKLWDGGDRRCFLRSSPQAPHPETTKGAGRGNVQRRHMAASGQQRRKAFNLMQERGDGGMLHANSRSRRVRGNCTSSGTSFLAAPNISSGCATNTRTISTTTAGLPSGNTGHSARTRRLQEISSCRSNRHEIFIGSALTQQLPISSRPLQRLR